MSALSFEYILETGSLDTAVEETLRRINGLSDGTVAAGEAMEEAFREVGESIEKAFQDIEAVTKANQKALQDLEDEYKKLGKAAEDAFNSGNDSDYEQINERKDAIQGEIVVRQGLLEEISALSLELASEEERMLTLQAATEQANQKYLTFQTRLLETKEALAQMELQGKSGTEEFAAMQEEVIRLQNAYGDSMLYASDVADAGSFDAITNALSGVEGGLSAASDAVSLFAGENEYLQSILGKVQNVMDITNGLMQVSEAINKGATLSINLLSKAKQWWKVVTVQATGATIAETTAIGTQATAATAGTVANWSLAGAFRAVGAAIMSIPVFGWIAAGITALGGAIAYFSTKSSDGKKDADELYKAIAKGAVKSISKVQNLAKEWGNTNGNLDKQTQFILENKKIFEQLGLAINDVAKAEEFFSSDENVGKFIAAQKKKAEAAALRQQADEQLKERIMLEKQLENTPETTTTWVNNGFGEVYESTGRNEEYDNLIEKITTANLKWDEFINNADKAESISNEQLGDLDVVKKGTYEKGSLGAINQDIQNKKAEAKYAKTRQEYKKIQQEIKELEMERDKITGGSKSTAEGEDPFIKMLKGRKAEYSRYLDWASSSDETVRNAAQTQFKSLIDEGASYLEYLKKQRDAIMAIDEGKRTSTQKKNLSTLNNTIAGETKNQEMKSFNKELDADLKQAKSTFDQLDIIKKRREALKDDSPLDKQKGEVLDKQKESVLQNQVSQTEALMQQYAGQKTKLLAIETKYNADIKLLEEKRSKAEDANNQEEVKRLNEVIANRKKAYEKDSHAASVDSDYQALLQEYGSFEEKKLLIAEKYKEKIAKAQENGNSEMVDKLTNSMNSEIFDLSLGGSQDTDLSKLFGDLDKLSTDELQKLLDKFSNLDDSTLGIKLSAEDKERIMKEVGEVQAKIGERNPFKALGNSIKAYRKAAKDGDEEGKKAAMKGALNSASSIAGGLSDVIGTVTDGFSKMGIEMDEETQVILADIQGIAQGAADIAQGIATGNPLQVVQGTITAVSSAIDMFNSGDRKAERRIKKHQQAIKKLENTYKELEWQIEKALGSDYYAGQQDAIANLKDQQQHIRQMREEEMGKKKTNKDKVDDYTEQIADIDRQVKDIIAEVSQDILQTDAKSLASELGDSLVEAFTNGEDAALAWEETVQAVMQNAVKNQLNKNVLEKQMQSSLDYLQQAMGFTAEGEGHFDGLTDEEIAKFKESASVAAGNYLQALEATNGLFEPGAEADTSLTGSIKGVSEETASVLGGNINNIRINQSIGCE